MNVSVIIPTRDRPDILARVLAALAPQVAPDDEIIVVDDGSADAPALARVVGAPGVGGRRRLVSLPSGRGPAAARNAGLQQARGDLILFSGDDTIPAPQLLARHRAVHRAYPEETVGCLGFVTWDPVLPPTPFMVWLEHGGGQNAYGEIAGRRWIDPSVCCYGANLSCKRSVLEKVGGFDAGHFPSYGWEDRDLGVRLATYDVRLVYEPAARAFHHHAHTVVSWRQRQQGAGRGWVHFVRAHPGHAQIPLAAQGWRYRVRRFLHVSPTGACLQALARAAERRWILPTLYGKVSGWEFTNGVHETYAKVPP